MQTASTSSSSSATFRNARAAALPAKLSRSWLLVNAAMPERFEAAQMSDADSVIFDMEAPVPEDGKEAARGAVVGALSDGMSGWVRVNSITSDHWSEDLAAIKGLQGLRGIMLPNTEHADQVTYTAMRVGAGVPVLALIETALGIENATRIAEAPGTFRLALGTNDFRKDTGVADDPIAMAYARSRLVIATRVGGLPGAIDGPSTVGAPRERVIEDCGWTMKMGMAGKLVLDTDQITVLNNALSPSADDRKWAREMLEQAEGGAPISDGSYLPRLARAKKIAQLADSYGLWNA